MTTTVTIQDSPHYKLRVQHSKPIRPDDLNTITFIRETYDDDGEFQRSSTEQYNLTGAELRTLVEALAYMVDKKSLWLHKRSTNARDLCDND
jgi:hypothetical protein